MTFKKLKNKIKEEQKALAQKITKGKTGRKPKNRTDNNIGDYNGLEYNQWNYRHTHIMYCQFFNKTPYALIEQPRDENKPSSHTLDKLKNQWEAEIDEEALRDCA
jgi:hypothetical protein